MGIRRFLKNYWMIIAAVTGGILVCAFFVHKSTFSQCAKDEENRLMKGCVSKLMSIAEQNPNALVEHGMGPTLGKGPEEFYEPLKHCRKFLKTRFFLHHPGWPKSIEEYEFVRLEFHEVKEFIDWAKDTIHLNEQVAFLSPDRLEFYRCVLIGFVQYKETDGRQVFHWRQDAKFSVSPTRKPDTS